MTYETILDVGFKVLGFWDYRVQGFRGLGYRVQGFRGLGFRVLFLLNLETILYFITVFYTMIDCSVLYCATAPRYTGTLSIACEFGAVSVPSQTCAARGTGEDLRGYRGGLGFKIPGSLGFLSLGFRVQDLRVWQGF